MKKAIFKLAGRRFSAPTMTAAAAAAAVLYRLTGVKTPAFRACLRSRRAAWLDHAAGVQSELNEERRRGWGFRYIDGARVDF